jgi:hypothetical protein
VKTEEEILQHKEELEGRLALKIARACVGYRENVSATIRNLRGQIEALEWVLED